MRQNNTYQSLQIQISRRVGVAIVGITLAGAILTSCDDGRTDVPSGMPQTLTLLPYARPLTDTRVSDTRADIDGVTVPADYHYFSQLVPKPLPQYETIYLFQTRGEADASITGQFVYDNDDDTWSSTIYVNEGQHYNFFGFMPSAIASKASITPASGNYDNGATISFTALDVLAPADVCVMTGLQDVGVLIDDDVITPLKGEVSLGKFGYTGKQKGRNFVRLLFDHLFSGLHFAFSVDPAYNQLRDIRLRSVSISTTSGATIDVTVAIEANETGSDPITAVTYTNPTPGTSEAIIYDVTSEDKGTLIPVSPGAFDILGSFAPTILGIGSDLTLDCTYDVYDKKGNLVREGCHARNKLPDVPTLVRGQKHVVNLTVTPTYLYQLSDSDLDNPTITITTAVTP